MVLLLHICRNSVSRSKSSDGAHSYTACIYSMYSVTEGEDVNGTTKFCVPWAISLEQFAINSAGQQFVSESVQGRLKTISSVTDNDEHHPVPLGRFCDCGADYKCPDLLSLLTSEFR